MIVLFGFALALLYSVDCLCAGLGAWRGRRIGWREHSHAGHRQCALLTSASALLMLGALGVLCSAVPRTASALALLGGAAFAAAGYIATGRLPFAPLARWRDERRRQHPWPFDPVPSAARGVSGPVVMTMALPALGSVVELNQN